MTSEITEAMVERAHEAYSTFGQVGHLRDQRPSDAHMKAILTAALAARPAPEAGSVVEKSEAWDIVAAKNVEILGLRAALAEANEKIERLERERAALHAAGKDARLSILKEEQARIERLKKALRALEEANDRLASARSTAIYNSLIDAGLADILMALDDARRAARAALQQEGE